MTNIANDLDDTFSGTMNWDEFAEAYHAQNRQCAAQSSEGTPAGPRDLDTPAGAHNIFHLLADLWNEQGDLTIAVIKKHDVPYVTATARRVRNNLDSLFAIMTVSAMDIQSGEAARDPWNHLEQTDSDTVHSLLELSGADEAQMDYMQSIHSGLKMSREMFGFLKEAGFTHDGLLSELELQLREHRRDEPFTEETIVSTLRLLDPLYKHRSGPPDLKLVDKPHP